MKPFEVEILEKSIEQKGNMLSNCYDEELHKSWSSDLQKRFPNGGWRTMNGAKVFVNGGKVVAGLDGFNGEIDKFFSEKVKAKEGKKKEVSKKEVKKQAPLTEREKMFLDSYKKDKDAFLVRNGFSAVSAGVKAISQLDGWISESTNEEYKNMLTSLKEWVVNHRKSKGMVISEEIDEGVPKSKDGKYQIYKYTTKGRDGEGEKTWYGVPKVENKGERGHGDSIYETLEEAIKEADNNRNEEAQYFKEKQAAEDAKKEEELKKEQYEKERKERNKGKTKVEIMNEARDNKTLDVKMRYDGVVKTRRQHVEDVIREGGFVETKQVNKVKEPSRRAWNRMDNNEQEQMEKKIKESGKTTEYRLVTKPGTFYTTTKAEYDYAVNLLSQKDK